MSSQPPAADGNVGFEAIVAAAINSNHERMLVRVVFGGISFALFQPMRTPSMEEGFGLRRPPSFRQLDREDAVIPIPELVNTLVLKIGSYALKFNSVLSCV